MALGLAGGDTFPIVNRKTSLLREQQAFSLPGHCFRQEATCVKTPFGDVGNQLNGLRQAVKPIYDDRQMRESAMVLPSETERFRTPPSDP